jgi:chromosomal replication initiation ATPase DnaA
MISYDTLLQRATTVFGIDASELRSKRGRSPRLVQARQALMYALHAAAGMSYQEIGRALGRDHTTVLYGARQAQARAASDPAYAAQLAQLLAAPPPSRGGGAWSQAPSFRLAAILFGLPTVRSA